VTTPTNARVTLPELAEEPDHHLRKIPPPARRLLTPRYTLLFSPSNTQSVTSHVRTTAADLDDTLAEVRREVRAAGFVGNVWGVGPSCRPEGLGRMLLERGFVPATRAPFEPVATAMMLAARPAIAAATPGLEVRLVRNVDEFREVIRIAMEAFNEAPEDAAGWYAAVPSLWAEHDGVSRFTHIAFLDGRPVGFGFASAAGGAALLGGSGVIESARGRGVYRALVAARWEEAQRLGMEGLVIHAGAMSKPIVERCGFQEVCQIDTYMDMSLGAT
jgi:GNAT superfamily N-acetyltransferase